MWRHGKSRDYTCRDERCQRPQFVVTTQCRSESVNALAQGGAHGIVSVRMIDCRTATRRR